MILARCTYVAGLADYDGRTALHLASSEGHKDIVAYLIDQVTPGPSVIVFVCNWHLHLGS